MIRLLEREPFRRAPAYFGQLPPSHTVPPRGSHCHGLPKSPMSTERP